MLNAPVTTRLDVIDSHTEGEPTRCIIAGFPELPASPGGTVAESVESFRKHFDHLRRATIGEPRGADSLVGALLLPPRRADCIAGVIFFNNVGFLHACGHGTMGVAATLAHLGRIGVGTHQLETPVGVVRFAREPDGTVAIENVPARRARRDVEVDVPGYGAVRGDVAWGGNWFFLVSDEFTRPCGIELELAHIDALTRFSRALRKSLVAAGVTGDLWADHASDRRGVGGAVVPANPGDEIDHIEIFGAPRRADCDSRNFVLCPGGAYDRSPCGTGTSAKMACLFEDGRLAEGQLWRQESVIGSRFVGSVRRTDQGLIPTLRGRAHVTAETTLLFGPDDPFRFGVESTA